MNANKETIKIAISGIGNCASALLQGLALYGKSPTDTPPGLIHQIIDNIGCDGIEVVAAFDIDKRKVGLPLKSAHLVAPNCVKSICVAEIPGAEVIVQMGHILDGYPGHMAEFSDDRAFVISSKSPVDVKKVLLKI